MDFQEIARRTRFTYKEVTALQKLPLEFKEKIACEVIRIALKQSRHTPAIAFSGGKDSEVVADLIERCFPDDFKRVHCIFGNTGIEFPESLQFAREYGNAQLLDNRPCVFDDFGDMVEIEGTWMNEEYDPEE